MPLAGSVRPALFVGEEEFFKKAQTDLPFLITTHFSLLIMIATISYTLLLAAIYVARKVVVYTKESQTP